MGRLQRHAHHDAVTQASGIWVTFIAVLALYVALGVGTVVTLRAMARRWRATTIPTRRAVRPGRRRAAGGRVAR